MITYPLKDTERGIKQLQTQLHSREQELILERNLRRQLQKELDNKINRNNVGGGDLENGASNFLMDDYAKPYAYFWGGFTYHDFIQSTLREPQLFSSSKILFMDF